MDTKDKEVHNMRNMKKSAPAVLLDNFDSVFLPEKIRKKLKIIVSHGSAWEVFAKSYFPAKNIISIRKKPGAKSLEMNFETTIKKTNLGQKLKEHGVREIMLPHRSSTYIETWMKKNNIKLLGTKWKLQKKFEDKLFFDKLLKENRIPSPKTFTKTPEFPCVVQIPDGFGMAGTTFCHTQKQFKKLPSIFFKKTIIREYLDGISIGVSIFIDRDGNFFFSGMRRQCFIFKDRFPKIFLGIQWFPNSVLPRQTIVKIEKILTQLVPLLKKHNVVGIANFDILIYKNEPYVLECNPRLSSATQHLFSVPNLCGHKNPWQFTYNAFAGIKNKKIRNAKLPNHHCQGCLLDIDIEKKIRIKKTPPIGMAKVEGTDVFICHELPHGHTGDTEITTLATILSDTALFNWKSGELNAKGKAIFKGYKKLI